MERMERKVERLRARTKRLKKSKKKAEAKLRRMQNQYEEVRIANRQAHQQVCQDNAFADAFVHINLAIFEAEDAGDFLTAEQLAQTLRLVFIIPFLNIFLELIRFLSYFPLLINLHVVI
ncbi:hypothetical protein SLA2020_070270 [Shorea laevis]